MYTAPQAKLARSGSCLFTSQGLRLLAAEVTQLVLRRKQLIPPRTDGDVMKRRRTAKSGKKSETKRPKKKAGPARLEMPCAPSMLRRVFVLGAGFSFPAGLPLARQLLEQVYKNLSVPKRDQLRDALSYFQPMDWGDGGSVAVTSALSTVVVEDFMSLLGIGRSYATHFPGDHWSASQIQELEKSLIRELALLFARLEREIVTQRSEYIRRFVSRLSPLDTIITFNWDTLVESSIRRAALNVAYLRCRNANDRLVLKLHGSVDWFHTDEVRVEFRPRCERIDRHLLQVPSQLPGETSITAPEANPQILPPTFFKNLDQATDFAVIWQAAATSIALADEVHLIGYRLPPEDLFARVLLRRSIRTNAERRQGILPSISAVNLSQSDIDGLRRQIAPEIIGKPMSVVDAPWCRFANTKDN